MVATDKRRQSQEYWEQRLIRMGLAVDAGEPFVRDETQPSGFLRWLQYGHVVSDLDFDGRNTYEVSECEDVTEWPQSLL